MALKIIYAHPDGMTVATVADWIFDGATETDRLVAYANQRLPAGTQYEIVDHTELPATRDFRNAWRFTPGAQVRTAGA